MTEFNDHVLDSEARRSKHLTQMQKPLVYQHASEAHKNREVVIEWVSRRNLPIAYKCCVRELLPFMIRLKFEPEIQKIASFGDSMKWQFGQKLTDDEHQIRTETSQFSRQVAQDVKHFEIQSSAGGMFDDSVQNEDSEDLEAEIEGMLEDLTLEEEEIES